MLLHIPILRRGEPYRSLDRATVVHHRTREPLVEVSQANVGLLRRDLLDQRGMRAALAEIPARELLAATRRAGELFATATLPLGDGDQSPEDYVRQTSATTGLPHVLVRRNMEKVRRALDGMETAIRGLTRDLDLDVLDHGHGRAGGHALSFVPRADALGVVLPSNSPGVHSLWAPAVALKTALVLKPGGAEPWTPYRMVQAFVRAGVPRAAFGYYPTDHAGALEVLRQCGRGMVFGDTSTTDRWKSDPRVEVHGPGYSKVLLGPDAAEDWRRHLDVMVASILENGGRSCVNASGVWTPAHGREIAEALAERLARVEPRAAEDEAAQIAPFADPSVAARISGLIDEGLAAGGAEEITARHRGHGRLVTQDGGTYLLPTIILCQNPDHPLANREFLFPFASVVETPSDSVPESLGQCLAVTAITEDPALVRRLLDSPLIHRLNLGPIPTFQVSFDQPHEGNLFEHLYSRRAVMLSLQQGGAAPPPLEPPRGAPE